MSDDATQDDTDELLAIPGFLEQTWESYEVLIKSGVVSSECLRNIMLGIMLLMLVGCAMPGRFEVEITPTEEGVKYHVITTKNYGLITATGSKAPSGAIEFQIKAEKVDSTAMGIQAIQTQSEAIKSLTGIIGLVPGQ